MSLLDASGRERLRVSRVEPDRKDSRMDLSQHPGLSPPSTRGSISAPSLRRSDRAANDHRGARHSGHGSVTLAEVNLKFVWAVVTEIKVGERGYAYVVDARGRLVAHPDISLVLQMTDLAALPRSTRRSPARMAWTRRDSRSKVPAT